MLNDKIVLITGGTGSFGHKFVEIVLGKYRPKKLIVFSRDELKQHEMRHRWPDDEGAQIRYFLGDVRDRDRLHRAFDQVDIVVHAAALKQVPASEYNPLEAVKTNVLGAANIIDAAIDCNVKQVIALSTDKAVNPINLYGATKLCAEKLFVAANNYSGHHGPRFSVVRYGNVVGSRGSVIPLFLKMKSTGRLAITDPRMTRFWLTIEQGVAFVLASLERMRGGDIFVPKIPSTSIMELAEVIAPECSKENVGIRAGEKVHEVLLTEDEARISQEFDDYFVIEPRFPGQGPKRWTEGKPLPDGFRYTSETNSWRLASQDLVSLIKEVEAEMARNGSAYA